MIARNLCFGLFTSAAFLAIGALPVRAAIVASWDFEEGSGTTVNDGVGGLDATQTGGAWVTSGNYNGAFGTSLQLVRSEADTVLAPYTSQLSGLTSMTVEVWVKYAGGIPGYGNARLVNMPGADVWYYNDGDPGGVGGLRMAMSGTATGYDWENLTQDGWTQIVATYDAGTNILKLYRNGALRVSGGPGTGLNLAGSDPIGLGNNSTGGSNFDGLIDHISISDTALSDADILDRYNAIVNFNVPEPASLACLGLGGLLTLARRRRIS